MDLQELHDLAEEQSAAHPDAGARHNWSVIREQAETLLQREGGAVLHSPIRGLTPVVDGLIKRVQSLEDAPRPSMLPFRPSAQSVSLGPIEARLSALENAPAPAPVISSNASEDVQALQQMIATLQGQVTKLSVWHMGGFWQAIKKLARREL